MQNNNIAVVVVVVVVVVKTLLLLILVCVCVSPPTWCPLLACLQVKPPPPTHTHIMRDA